MIKLCLSKQNRRKVTKKINTNELQNNTSHATPTAWAVSKNIIWKKYERAINRFNFKLSNLIPNDEHPIINNYHNNYNSEILKILKVYKYQINNKKIKVNCYLVSMIPVLF